jgi:chromatin structure-remodeling complex subunit RSC1/2
MAPSKSPSSDARASEKPDNEDTKPEDTALETTERSGDGTPSTVTDKEYEAMHNILTNVYGYRTEDGDDPSKLFHRKVNKRAIPDYYDVIKEPMAMSTVKAKINMKEYKSFEEFVRDWALICHNAQVYNSPNAQAYQDALTIRGVVLEELAKAVAVGVVSKARAELPFLGEIPPADEMVIEEIEEDDDDEEDDEVSSEEEEEGKKKRKRGRPSLASKLREAKGESKDKDEDDPESRKKRGRPPRVDTPLEARIKAVMKGMRKPKNAGGELIIGHFERLPDKVMVPEYFAEIKNPIAMDQIKKKLKRKKYNSVDQFMRDVEIMFANAMSYNEDGSDIYEAAVELRTVARKLAEDEKKKPDAEFAMEDGRIPVPDGILHNGELWKVGEYLLVHSVQC